MAVKAKTIRIIALDPVAARAHHTKIVNVSTVAPTPIREYSQVLQATGKALANEYPELMASGAANANIKGLPTVYIPGYSGPA